PGQEDVKGCSLPRLAVDTDHPAMARDDSLHYRQPHPGTFSDLLGGKVRVEYTLFDGWLHAVARVAYRKPDVLTGHKVRIKCNQRCIDLDILQRDIQNPT